MYLLAKCDAYKSLGKEGVKSYIISSMSISEKAELTSIYNPEVLKKFRRLEKAMLYKQTQKSFSIQRTSSLKK